MFLIHAGNYSGLKHLKLEAKCPQWCLVQMSSPSEPSYFLLGPPRQEAHSQRLLQLNSIAAEAQGGLSWQGWGFGGPAGTGHVAWQG